MYIQTYEDVRLVRGPFGALGNCIDWSAATMLFCSILFSVPISKNEANAIIEMNAIQKENIKTALQAHRIQKYPKAHGNSYIKLCFRKQGQCRICLMISIRGEHVYVCVCDYRVGSSYTVHESAFTLLLYQQQIQALYH